jgi:hypothetical protein
MCAPSTSEDIGYDGRSFRLYYSKRAGNNKDGKRTTSSDAPTLRSSGTPPYLAGWLTGRTWTATATPVS